MKTLAEIGYSIRNQCKGYFSTDDERISIDFVYDKAWDIRSMLIKEEWRKFHQLNDNDFTTECCLKISCDEIVCDDKGSGVYEHTIIMPTLESSLGYNSIKYFGSVDKKTPFRRVNYGGYLYSGYSSFTGNAPTFTLIDNKAVLKNLPDENMEYVCVIGIFENSRDYCKPEDPFPIARHLVHKLELLAIQQIMSTIQIGPDEYNNAKDDSPMAINPVNKVPNSG